MIRATVQEGNNVSVEEYEYDGLGNRTAKLTEAEKTYYLNDIYGSLTQVLEERDENGNVKCHYTRGEELISQEREGVISIYLTGGHGSVRQLSDIEGNVTDTYVYDAWGNMISQEGETENSYLYCGEQQDDTTGLYYLRARYMSPQTGTFTSMDTYGGTAFDPVSLHKYLYANSNPVSYTDPSGYFSLGEVVTSMAISTSLGGLIGAGFGVLNEIIRQKIINPNAQFNFQKIKEGMLNGLWFGLGIGFLAGIGTVFACAFIFELLGAIGIFSGLSALVSAYYDWNEYHNGYLVGYDIILAIISFIGSGKSFQQADKISVAKSRAASAKAKSTTNTTKKEILEVERVILLLEH